MSCLARLVNTTLGRFNLPNPNFDPPFPESAPPPLLPPPPICHAAACSELCATCAIVPPMEGPCRPRGTTSARPAPLSCPSPSARALHRSDPRSSHPHLCLSPCGAQAAKASVMQDPDLVGTAKPDEREFGHRSGARRSPFPKGEGAASQGPCRVPPASSPSMMLHAFRPATASHGAGPRSPRRSPRRSRRRASSSASGPRPAPCPPRIHLHSGRRPSRCPRLGAEGVHRRQDGGESRGAGAHLRGEAASGRVRGWLVWREGGVDGPPGVPGEGRRVQPQQGWPGGERRVAAVRLGQAAGIADESRSLPAPRLPTLTPLANPVSSGVQTDLARSSE